MCVLYMSHKICLLLIFIEIEEFLLICFTTTVHQITKASKKSIISRNFNFTSDVSIHDIITCQGIFVPVPEDISSEN